MFNPPPGSNSSTRTYAERLQFNRAKRAFWRKIRKVDSKVMITSASVIGVLAVLNFLSFQVDQVVDLTETGEFSLSAQTIAVLEKLEKPVQVTCYFRPGDDRRRTAKDYLERYRRHTNLVSYQFRPLNSEANLGEDNTFVRFGMIFTSENRQVQIYKINEAAITEALIKVTHYQGADDYNFNSNRTDFKSSTQQIFLTSLEYVFLLVTVLIILPMPFFVAGIIVWWKRR